MGDARRRSVNSNGLFVPDRTLVAPNGDQLVSSGSASVAAAVKHYGVVLRENGAVIRQHAVDDPFITATFTVSGWRQAWMVLRGRYTIEVQVHGDETALKAVFGPHVAIQR